MKVAIMQPYFLPYIGYYQLMNAVDEFVVYDNIEFTKKGWINRNRILVNGNDAYITLPLKKDSDYLDIKDRSLADTWEVDRKKLLNKINEAYRKAPYYDVASEVITTCILFEEKNLFYFIYHSLEVVKHYLGITTPLSVSSSIPANHELKSEKRVIEICKAKKATGYLNPIGGVELYDKEEFKNAGIELNFLKSKTISYKQYDNEFVPWLSMIDLMMFNSKERIKEYLTADFTIS